VSIVERYVHDNGPTGPKCTNEGAVIDLPVEEIDQVWEVWPRVPRCRRCLCEPRRLGRLEVEPRG
jgi:hypothetical protein